MESRKHTNIMLMSAPHRYDLITSTCLNSEEKVFNRKLYKQMKVFDHTALLHMNLNRDQGNTTDQASRADPTNKRRRPRGSTINQG